MDSTLLLNADGMPVNLLPLSSVTWEDAVKSMYTGDSEVLHYHDWAVHSPSVTIQVPSVLILKEQIKVKRNLRLSTTGPSANLIFLRDEFTCQYCCEVFPRKQLTMDHVLPKKYGGRTRWENVTSACATCNGRRGHDMRIQPKKHPWRPTFNELIKTMKKFPIFMADISWNYYLGWKEELVTIVDPRSTSIVCSDYFQ